MNPGLTKFLRAFGRLPCGLSAQTQPLPPTIACKPARPDLGPNQLEWCSRRIRGFRACRKAVKQALRGQAKAEALAKGLRS